MKRVGLIIPASNRMVEQEMAAYCPAGVQPHVTRLRMTGRDQVPLQQLLPRIAEATRALADARCDVVVFHCTANSTEDGLDGEKSILSAMTVAGGPQVTTTATALRSALEVLEARRIVIVTPYDARTTEHEAQFFRAAGYEVPRAVGHDLGGSDQFCAASCEFWFDRVVEAAMVDVDAYLLSCANISAFAAIEPLERRLGRPLLTSNQAVLWQALRLLGWAGGHGCPGRLFETLAAAEPARARA